jgi:hypothetical protein
LQQRKSFIDVFALLGTFLEQFPEGVRKDTGDLAMLNAKHYADFREVLEREPVLNPWFTPQWLDLALKGIARMLERENLEKWLETYRLPSVSRGKEKLIGLVLAGNIPLVGFHDIMCVLASGHRILARASTKDDRLIVRVAEFISSIDPPTGERIILTEDPLKGMDAVIATGSNNSARYFEYYFRDIPHIIRKNRNGVAVLTGNETEEELGLLGLDIFSYFGLGCRNVTKIFVPRDYDLRSLLAVLDQFSDLGQHHKYANNVDYYRTIYLLNKEDFLDNGVLLLKQDRGTASPVGVVFYERYSELGELRRELKLRSEEIQCIVSLHPGIENALVPGMTQVPMPWDYADGVDTLRFLAELD